MRNINCRWNYEHRWCLNSNIKRSWFGLGERKCIEAVSEKACKLIDPYPKPAPSPTLPRPKNLTTKVGGLTLNCCKCGRLITKQGALLFSPPKGNLVEKYHFCYKCYEALKKKFDI